MDLSVLRKQKKEWLNSTVSATYLKRRFKLNEAEIAQIKSEVKYGRERYEIRNVKLFLDMKIDENISNSDSVKKSTKTCNQCNKKVNKNYFSNSKTKICIKCERAKELVVSRKLEEINRSRNQKVSRNQIPLL